MFRTPCSVKKYLSTQYSVVYTLSVLFEVFYFVSHEDDDIRQYTWDMIGSTVRIFVAVLVSLALKDCVHDLCGDTWLANVGLALRPRGAVPADAQGLESHSRNVMLSTSLPKHFPTFKRLFSPVYSHVEEIRGGALHG